MGNVINETAMGRSIESISDSQQAKHYTDRDCPGTIDRSVVASGLKVILEEASRDPQTLQMFARRVVSGASYKAIAEDVSAVTNKPMSEEVVRQRICRLKGRLSGLF